MYEAGFAFDGFVHWKVTDVEVAWPFSGETSVGTSALVEVEPVDVLEKLAVTVQSAVIGPVV